MTREKTFDCIKFKYELQEKTLKKSGAKNLREYVEYVNKTAKMSSLHKSKETLYRMLQEGENSIASGKTLTKEEVLKNMETA